MRNYFYIVFLMLFNLLLLGCGTEENATPETPPNPNAPTMDAITDKSVILGGAVLTFSISATDPNSSTLTYSMSGSGFDPMNVGMTLGPDTGNFSWNYSNANPGDYSVTFTVTNAEQLSDNQNVVITVRDDSPILSSIGSKSITLGGSALSFNLSATDPNNLTVTFSADGSVGSGTDPFTLGANLSGNTFTWDVTANSVPAGTYTIRFTAMNTNGKSDFEDVTIRVQDATTASFTNGESLYGARCQSCHGAEGVGGSKGLIQCIDSATFNEKVNGGSMTGYASGWSTQDKQDVWYYLNNVHPENC